MHAVSEGTGVRARRAVGIGLFLVAALLTAFLKRELGGTRK